MPRPIDIGLLNALQGDSFEMAHLIYFDVGGGIYITDHAHDITAIDTYLASSHLIGVGSPSESRDLKVNSLNVTLSGVDQAFISTFLQNDWINRKASIKKAVVAGGGLVGTVPLTVFDGQITRFQVSESQRGSDLTVGLASHWADFEKKAGRLTNNNSQQYFFPDDVGFEYAASTVKDIRWGRK